MSITNLGWKAKMSPSLKYDLLLKLGLLKIHNQNALKDKGLEHTKEKLIKKYELFK